jgi:GTPase SAR1 family protein
MKVGANPFNEIKFNDKSPASIIEAKVVLLGDSGVGKSSIA